MNILLIQDDANIREKVVFVLDSQFNAMVWEAEGPEQAKAILSERGGQTQLIVFDCDSSKADECNKLRAEYSAIPSIVFLHGEHKRLAISAPPGHPVPIFIDRSDIVQNLTSTIGGMIKRKMLPDPDDDRNFCKIRTKLLLSVCPLESDIYIRLSESKYLKLMREGDTFDSNDLEKYTVKKGVEYLYIRNKEIQEFVRKFQNELMNYLDRKPIMKLEEVAKLSDSVYETVQSLAESVGFKPEVQQIAKAQVQLAVRAMGKSPKLSKLLDKLESFQGKYIASHSTMTGYLACSIASQMKWGSETTFHKLNLAAFMHDITLTNHDLAACTTLKETEDPRFTDAERQLYKSHATKAAEIARGFTEVPPDVDIIIAQHHERPDGTGFPRGLTSTYIAPLSAIFIVAHDMAKFAMAKGKEFRPVDFVAARADDYKPSQFRKVMQAVEQLV